MDFRAVGGDNNKATVVFSPLENIVFGQNGQSIISADFDFPGRTADCIGFNAKRYNSQLFIEGDFSQSWDAAMRLKGRNPGFNILGNNCVWVALEVLQQSTEGTSAYNALEMLLWQHNFRMTGFLSWEAFKTESRNTLIPNHMAGVLERIMQNAGYSTSLTDISDTSLLVLSILDAIKSIANFVQDIREY